MFSLFCNKELKACLPFQWHDAPLLCIPEIRHCCSFTLLVAVEGRKVCRVNEDETKRCLVSRRVASCRIVSMCSAVTCCAVLRMNALLYPVHTFNTNQFSHLVSIHCEYLISNFWMIIKKNDKTRMWPWVH